MTTAQLISLRHLAATLEDASKLYRLERWTGTRWQVIMFDVGHDEALSYAPYYTQTRIEEM